MDIDNFRGIVFRAVDFGETSKILTIFTRNEGIISVMARGVKNPKSKKQNLVSVFTEADFELTKSKDFYYIKDGEIVNDNLHLRDSIIKIYIAQLFFDIMERMMLKNEKNEIVYDLLAKSISYLSLTNRYITVLNMYLIKVISILGYKPELFNCTICGNKKLNKIYFSQSVGGILCENHKNHDAIILDYYEYEYLYSILVQVYEKIDIINNRVDEKKILKILMNFIRYNVDISMPNSYKTLSRLIGIN
ncbi:DNA repair protein RecO [Helcococcus ovis]|nr:DNA repair protein RecO [Helcococcus ovis]WNZ01022.1 DNA repair protein RecO [Helcococcus ovis]